MIDWHGHRDMGNALANSLMAIAAGARYVHVVSRGIGERSGNTSLEDLVLNLTAILNGVGQKGPWEVSQLMKILSLYEEIVHVATPEHGTLGKRYNHTTLGIHTDAIFKANVLADRAHVQQNVEVEHHLRKMARIIYSAIDPHMVGDEYSIGVSQWSGRSSVKLAYRLRGGDPETLSVASIDAILAKAKEQSRELEPTELDQLFRAATQG
jgi:2-isopropylmalate synthase